MEPVEWVMLAIMLISAAYVITHPPPSPPAAVIQEFNVPSIEEGSEVRVVFGTDIVMETQLIDMMAKSTSPIKVSSGK